MSTKYLIILGLSLDILGAFLLAVEAIKIENLRVFRDKLLKRFNSYILGPSYEKRIYLDSNTEDINQVKSSEQLPVMGCVPLMILHVIIGNLIFGIILKVANLEISKIIELINMELPLLFRIVLYPLILLFLIIFCGFFGSNLITFFSKIIILFMKFIDFIEEKTPSGTIGIIGFLILTIGFLCQIIANII